MCNESALNECACSDVMLTSENLKTMDHLMTNLIVFVEVSLYVVVFRIREDIEKGKKAES